jgi:class 3 adenylate cyclase/tetratricopeptide (TPR) repeat protein
LTGGEAEAVSATGSVTSKTGAEGYAPYLSAIHLSMLATSAAPAAQELDGSLVFADVSGFTPLTEKLAKRGKIGAEELTDILNDVFSQLLDRATAFGGDLLKFGGDALLLLFRGPDHAVRACAAAAAMQQAIRPYRDLATAGGRVSLRMSVGVSSGPVLLFLVGTSHREMLVGGPAMSRVCELEAAADATEILVSSATAAAVDPSWIGEAKADGVLLRRTVKAEPPDATDVIDLTRAVEIPDAADGIPVGLRDHLAHRQDEGEHRIAVLTFIQFKGVDSLLATEGNSVTAEVLHQLVSTVQQMCERHGVRFLATDLDKDGGKILLAAGAPTASEDDADRTLRAVLDILAATPPQLAVRAGVNRGRAFAVDIGSRWRRTYAIMGDPTNLAARVMGKAEPGQLVATQAALEQLQTRYELRALEPFMVKGKSYPITASVVRRMEGVAVRSGTETHLVGRRRERDALHHLVAAAKAGTGGVVELVAEPGMGKSRLVEDFLDHARGLPRLVVEAAHYASSSPYLAMRGALRRVFTGLDAELDDGVMLQATVGALAPHLAEYIPLLGRLFGLEIDDTPTTAALDPEFRRSSLHTVAVELIAAALPGPAVIAIEDMHWLDQASAELLTGLLAEAGERAWAVCATRRPGREGLVLPAGFTDFVLEPLSAAAVRVILGEQLTASLPPATMARLVDRSGGNPLFLHELVHAVDRGEDPDNLPDTVEALIAARIDQLASDDRSLLRQSAVLGGRFTADMFAELNQLAEDEAQAALARLDEFVEPEAKGLRFRHALVREAAYEGLPYRRRRRLHARAGAIIEERQRDDIDEWADLLSLHFSQAGDADRTWRYSRVAGERAQKAFAPVEAMAFYRRAADAARQLDDVSDDDLGGLFETLGVCAEQAGQYTEASAAFNRARKVLIDNPLRLAEILRREGWVRERSGRYGDALRWYTRAQRLIAGSDLPPDDDEVRRLRARLAIGAGTARLRQGRYTESLPLIDEAVALAKPLGDEETLAHAYFLLDWAHTDLGNDERYVYRELSLPIYEKLGNLHRQGIVMNNLGIDAYFEGRWNDALNWYVKGRKASERAGDVVHMATATNNLGEVESDRGHLDEAKRLFAEARRVWEPAPFPAGVAVATSNLGRAAVRGGELDEGRVLLDSAREQWKAIGADSYVIETDIRQVERLVAGGEHAAALELVGEIERAAERAGGLPLLLLTAHRMAAYALAQAGDVDGALARLDDVVERARPMSVDFELALTLEAIERVLTAAGRPVPDPVHTEMTEIFTRLGVERTPEIPLASVRPRRQRSVGSG